MKLVFNNIGIDECIIGVNSQLRLYELYFLRNYSDTKTRVVLSVRFLKTILLFLNYANVEKFFFLVVNVFW